MAIRVSKGFGAAGAAVALWLGGSAGAHAASLCPSSVPQVVTKSKLVCVEFDPSSGQCTKQETQFYQATVVYEGVQLQNGQCTNAGAAGVDPAAFSGAALASQALSELSQSSAQETARSAEKSVAGRREEEINRCAAGFRRVDGACERIPAPAAEAPEPAAAAPVSRPAPRRAAKHAQKSAARHVAPEPARAVTPAFVSKDGPVPVPVEAPARYGVWGEVFGNYERRDAFGPAAVSGPDFNNGSPVGTNTYVTAKTGLVGFHTGLDYTMRGVFAPGDGVIVGALAGFSTSTMNLNTQTASAQPDVVGPSSTYLHARVQGPTLGAYASYFTGPFSADILAKFDLLSVDQNFTDSLAFGGPAGPFNAVFSGGGGTSLLTSTVAANLNYRFILDPRFYLEPTVGARFTWLGYGGGAADLGLANGNRIVVQGGARLGTSGLVVHDTPVSITLTGLAYSAVAINGGFLPGAAFNADNLLASADRNQVRGLGRLAFNLDHGGGLSSYLAGDVYGGKGLIGAGGRAGVRYEW
ncbi:hypothetical protein [Methylocella sp.]|uniref:hypothetical protein n=1 Tax=Methylocella sp. TaxID=1978226 RepID=UPI00378392FB